LTCPCRHPLRQSSSHASREIFGLVRHAQSHIRRAHVRHHAHKRFRQLMSASPLIPSGVVVQPLKRARIPAHAFSEADRLFARPHEATLSPTVAIPNLCWRNWHRSNITAHDGTIAPDHPLIIRALDAAQSATSLRSMIRDPQAFVWRYVLGCRHIVVEDQPLTVDARTYGELVHELLRRTVDLLEPEPGYPSQKCVGASSHVGRLSNSNAAKGGVFR
jgi:hypothetical protein